jgi:hypothetical protein
MVCNDSGAWLIRYVPTGQCLRRTGSSAWTGPEPTLSAIVGVYDGLACASRGLARQPGLARIDRHRAGHDDDQVMVLTLAADPASGIWLASAAIRYRMLTAALVSSAERAGAAWPDLRCALSIGLWQRPRQHDGGVRWMR